MNTSEDEVIARLRRGFETREARARLPLGLDDDAALLVPKSGHKLILTCDWFLEGTHFLRDRHPARSVAWKCLARGISDIAAMGGEPQCFLLSLALPKDCSDRWFGDFVQGLQRASQEFHCFLAGGDTTRHSQMLINVSVIGEVRKGFAVLRSGARPGDAIFASGRLGQAELGLEALRNAELRPVKNDVTLKKHLYPEPRLALGQWLARNKLASAMMDLSDGLSTDLPRLCRASRVGARVLAAQIPSAQVSGSKGLRVTRRKLLDLALNGGDDYELLFTVRPKNLPRIPASFQGVALSRIGEMISGGGIKIVQLDGGEEPLPERGWDPFRR